jgi:hypothetical protein
MYTVVDPRARLGEKDAHPNLALIRGGVRQRRIHIPRLGSRTPFRTQPTQTSTRADTRLIVVIPRFREMALLVVKRFPAAARAGDIHVLKWTIELVMIVPPSFCP